MEGEVAQAMEMGAFGLSSSLQYVPDRFASTDELIALAQDLGVRLIPCQMTMDLLGLKREDLLEGLEEPIGAATAIREMREAAIPLFI